MDKFYKCEVYVQRKEVEDEMDNKENYYPAKSRIDLSEVMGWYETTMYLEMGLEQTIILRLRNGNLANIIGDDESFAKVMKQYESSTAINFINN